MPSPVGELTLIGSNRGLAAILWKTERLNRVCVKPTGKDASHLVLRETQRQLEEYFAGERKTFALRLDFAGTDFQKNVWGELLKIPFGETRTYGEIAKKLGNPTATRAVGAANGRNPIAIVAPCHRVIGASGALTGFAGGLEVKAYLLRFERGETEFDFGGGDAAV